jgi:hypothetical protein
MAGGLSKGSGLSEGEGLSNPSKGIWSGEAGLSWAFASASQGITTDSGVQITTDAGTPMYTSH